jgi:hypothetical protein
MRAAVAMASGVGGRMLPGGGASGTILLSLFSLDMNYIVDVAACGTGG